MKFRKIVPVLLSMTFCLSSTMLPALPAGAAAHNGNGTAGVNVTVTVEDADDGSTGDRIPDGGGTGDEIPGGGAGEQTPGSGGGDDAKPGQDDGGSGADTDKDKDEGRDKNKDKDKGSGGNNKGGEDKGADHGNRDFNKGAGGKQDPQNPSGCPDILPASDGPAGGKPDVYSDLGKRLDDGAGDNVGDDGDLNEQWDDGESGNADAETGESGGDGDESGGTGDSGSEINGFVKMALRYWKQAALAVLALAVSASAFFFARRKIRFHGILADKDIDGVLFRGNTDSADGAAVLPKLIEELNKGGISFEEYEDMVMRSGSVTLLPAGTKMSISVTDAGLTEKWPAIKADECRMYGRLGEAALLAQIKGQAVVADVVLKHDRKGIEIPLHFVFQ